MGNLSSVWGDPWHYGIIIYYVISPLVLQTSAMTRMIQDSDTPCLSHHSSLRPCPRPHPHPSRDNWPDWNRFPSRQPRRECQCCHAVLVYTINSETTHYQLNINICLLVIRDSTSTKCLEKCYLAITFEIVKLIYHYKLLMHACWVQCYRTAKFTFCQYLFHPVIGQIAKFNDYQVFWIFNFVL